MLRSCGHVPSELNLGFNVIGAEGAAALARALSSSAALAGSLTSFVLRENQLRDVGAEALATALRANGARGRLQVLDLARNGIRSRGLRALAGCLNCCVALIQVSPHSHVCLCSSAS